MAQRYPTYSTPRRLAVIVEGVLARQEDVEEKLTGPSWKVAFKDGAPTAAAEAFAKKAGVETGSLEKVTNTKGEYVGATVKRQGQSAADLLAAELPKEVLAIYWAKNMYWRAGKPERFVRPVRWIVALMDSDVIPVEIAGIAAGNVSRGHRMMHGNHGILIQSAKTYSEELTQRVCRCRCCRTQTNDPQGAGCDRPARCRVRVGGRMRHSWRRWCI